MIMYDFNLMDPQDYKFIIELLYSESYTITVEDISKFLSIYKKYSLNKSSDWYTINTVVAIFSIRRDFDWLIPDILLELSLTSFDLKALKFLYDICYFDINRSSFSFIINHDIIGHDINESDSNRNDIDMIATINIISHVVSIIEDESINNIIKLIIARKALNLNSFVYHASELITLNGKIANFIINAEDEQVDYSNEILAEVIHTWMR